MILNKKNKLSIGVIGKDNHAHRLINILEKSELVDDIRIYYYRAYEGDDYRVTSDFSKLESCDAIILASPTPSHFEYLQKLSDFPGYIFAEKPLVSDLGESIKIMNWSESKKMKIKVNYSFIDSPVYSKLNEIVNTKEFGSPIEMSIRMGHGYSFSDQYLNNWRSVQSKYGVAEQISVHFINLAMHLFGSVSNSRINLTNFSGRGNTPDTSDILLQMAGSLTVKIFTSYAIPYQFELLLTCTNGIYQYDGKVETIRSPRDFYNKRNQYTLPPITYENAISYRENMDRGLEKSLSDFLTLVADNGFLNSEQLDTALITMEPIFNEKIQ